MIEENLEPIFRDAIDFVRELTKDDATGHDAFHAQRVFRTAAELAKAEHADPFVTGLCALLHDADDEKLFPETAKTKAHAVAFLKAHEVPGDRIDAIITAIGEISFRGSDSVVPSAIEGKCVQDADRLDALGAVGIARAFAYGGARHRKMYDPDEPPVPDMSGEEYHDHVSTTVNHFCEKLFLLPAMMNTEEGKRLAKKRAAYMKDYLSHFFAEWNGDGLKE